MPAGADSSAAVIKPAATMLRTQGEVCAQPPAAPACRRHSGFASTPAAVDWHYPQAASVTRSHGHLADLQCCEGYALDEASEAESSPSPSLYVQSTTIGCTCKGQGGTAAGAFECKGLGFRHAALSEPGVHTTARQSAAMPHALCQCHAVKAALRPHNQAACRQAGPALISRSHPHCFLPGKP